ncbi:MAG: hypothetical protein WED00_05825 [Aquisalimonadaceae bacterium]
MNEQSITERFAALTDMCREAMRSKVIECLSLHRRPMTSRDIALALELDHDAVQRVACYLVAHGKLDAAQWADGKPLYRPVDLGECEWCGLFDHHLVAGECPQCRARSQNYDPHRVIQEAAVARQEEEAHVIDHA